MPVPTKVFLDRPLFARDGFAVRGYGFREPMGPGLIHRPSGTGDCLFMLFHTAAQFGAEAAPPPLRAGGFFVWDLGARQHYGREHRGYVHSWLHCEGPAVGELLRAHGIPVREALPLGATPFLSLLRGLHAELGHRRPDPVIAAHLFENWVRAAARELDGDGPPVPELLRTARDHIDRHYGQPLTLAKLAAIARLSPSHFSSCFRRHFGTPPGEYLIRRRLRHAAYLLQDVNLSVTEVARRVGYDDLFHFSKLFKKFHGASPRAWRQRRPEAGTP